MIVLDASAWIDALTGVVSPPDPVEQVVVPPHFDAEVVGSLRALSQRGVISADAANHALAQHLRAEFTVERHEADIRASWRWRDSMSVAAAWSAALALRRDATWVTTDRRAAAAAQRHGVTVAVLS